MKVLAILLSALLVCSSSFASKLLVINNNKYMNVAVNYDLCGMNRLTHERQCVGQPTFGVPYATTTTHTLNYSIRDILDNNIDYDTLKVTTVRLYSNYGYGITINYIDDIVAHHSICESYIRTNGHLINAYIIFNDQNIKNFLTCEVSPYVERIV